jgi:hypothetical protein
MAVLVCIPSACLAYFWFYAIAPMRRTLDPTWYRQHSAEAYWAEVKTGIRRYRWGHDDPVGCFANAEFMAWAMSQTRPDDDISGCSAGHRDKDFRQITNQDPGDSAAEWLAWWKENEARSQEEWIRDGFTPHGVTVSIPPSEADTIPLLTLLGNVSTNEADQIPWFVKYNAFRWLRDSDFNPVAFAVSNVTESTQAQVKTGLLEYFRRERIYPKRDHVGELTFGRKDDPYADYPLPAMLEPRFKAGVYGIIFGLPCLAAGLIAWSLRKPRHGNVEPESPGYGSQARRT